LRLQNNSEEDYGMYTSTYETICCYDSLDSNEINLELRRGLQDNILPHTPLYKFKTVKKKKNINAIYVSYHYLVDEHYIVQDAKWFSVEELHRCFHTALNNNNNPSSSETCYIAGRPIDPRVVNAVKLQIKEMFLKAKNEKKKLHTRRLHDDKTRNKEETPSQSSVLLANHQLVSDNNKRKMQQASDEISSQQGNVLLLITFICC